MQSDCRFDALRSLNFIDSTMIAHHQQTNFTSHKDFERSKFFNVCSPPNHLIASLWAIHDSNVDSLSTADLESEVVQPSIIDSTIRWTYQCPNRP